MENTGLDIAACRRSLNYPASIYFKRVLWGFARPLFRFSPRRAFGWRAFLLRAFGARVGKKVHIYATAEIYMPWNLEIGDWSAIGEHAYIYNLGRVKIGERATVSHKAHLCAGTHDHRRADFRLLTQPVTIGDHAWIAAEAFVGPSVIVGAGAVVGARAVATSNVEPWTIVAGNPARRISSRTILS